MRRRWFLVPVVFAVAACSGPAAAAPSSSASASVPAATASAAPTAVASADPTAAPTDSAAYACADSSGGGPGRANVVTVRGAAGTGYDRFVIEFDGPVPGYRVTRQNNANFIVDASGMPVTLDGSAGVVVRLEPASSAPSAPRGISPRSSVLRDARNVGDFEAVVHWGVGLASPACMHVFTLDSPSRLVIDFKT
jgi:hypothetical protein